MIGRLPRRCRVLIWLAGVLASAGVGGWISFATPLPVFWRTGALFGLTLGVLATGWFLRVMEESPESLRSRGT